MDNNLNFELNISLNLVFLFFNKMNCGAALAATN